MKSSQLATSVVLLLAGCASPGYDSTGYFNTGYYSTYKVSGSPIELSSRAAEDAQLAESNAKALAGNRKFDQPFQLLRAPQPVMSPEDTDAKVVGRVVVEVHFSESGTVEQASIIESTKTSLSESVVAAVTQWAIAPVTRQGKPAKFVVRQTFSFKTAP